MEELDPRELYQVALDNFIRAMNIPIEMYVSKKRVFRLPIIPLKVVIQLAKDVKELFEKEPIVLRLEAPIIIVGDIHGHILDLFRILRTHRLPPMQKYLFLGDFVDRGEFSSETILMIFLLKVLYPDYIYCIRGNHEFKAMFAKGGFQSEMFSLYNTQEPIDIIADTFTYMPLVATIGTYMLCVHGGIGPRFKDLSQIQYLVRPIENFNIPAVDDLLWSDPSDSVDEYAESPRGEGHLFGRQPLLTFLENHGFGILVRGHQAVERGFEMQFSGRILTVFSCSSYCGLSNNSSSCLIVNTDSYEKDIFPPLPYIKRAQASLFVMPPWATPPQPAQPFAPVAISPPQEPRTSRRRQMDVRVQSNKLGRADATQSVPSMSFGLSQRELAEAQREAADARRLWPKAKHPRQPAEAPPRRPVRITTAAASKSVRRF